MSMQGSEIQRSALPATGGLTALGTGGEGTVYSLPASAVPPQVARVAGNREVVYKQFRTPDSPDKARHHRAVVEVFWTFNDAQKTWILDRTAWPLATVVDGGAVVGILMPVIPAMFYRDLPTPSGGTVRRPMDFQLLLNDAHYLRKIGLRISVTQRYALLLAACNLLRVLQGSGIVVGDFSAKNLMFALGEDASGAAYGSVYLIDCDSVTVAASTNPDSVETPGWNVPAGESRQTAAADRYKFGLLVLRLLTGDQTTRDPQRLPEDVPSGVQMLVGRSLDAAPDDRTTFDAWWDVLQSAALTAEESGPAVVPVVTASKAAAASAPTIAPVARRTASTKMAQSAPASVTSAPEANSGDETATGLFGETATRIRAVFVLVLLLIAAYAVSVDWFALSWSDAEGMNYNMVSDTGYGGFQYKWVLYAAIAWGTWTTVRDGLVSPVDREFTGGGAGMVLAAIVSVLFRMTFVSNQIMNYGDDVSISFTTGAWIYLVTGSVIILLTWGYLLVCSGVEGYREELQRLRNAK